MPVALRWIEIDDDAGVLALEFGSPGVVLLAVKKDGVTDATKAYWMDDQGNVLGRIQAGRA